MSSKPLILVTGISGFLGSHIAIQLLEAGYPVRGTAREAKAEILRAQLSPKYPSLEIVVVNDIASDNLKDALSGVGAVIHVASPIAGKEAPQRALKSALDGTLSILQSATEIGITKFVVTGTWASTADPNTKQVWQGLTFTEDSWGHTTREEVLSGKLNPLEAYIACKILTERAAWEFAAANPQVDISTINPPFIYGPLLEDFPDPSPTGLGSNRLIYQLISGEGGRPLPPQFVPYAIDVRDAARAHIAALELPKGAVQKPKRFIISGGALLLPSAIKHILKTRPELKDRLPSIENPASLPGPLSTIDTSLAKEYLHMTDYIPLQDTIMATLDSLLRVEKTWKNLM